MRIFFQIIGKWNENLMMNVSGKPLDALKLSCNVAKVTKPYFDISDVIWGVDGSRLTNKITSNGYDVFLPKSRCSEPCDRDSVKVAKHGSVTKVEIYTVRYSV